MKRVMLIIVFLTLLSSEQLFANNSSRGEGMGGATTALKDTTGIINNPACISGQERLIINCGSSFINNEIGFDIGFITPKKKWGNIGLNYGFKNNNLFQNYNKLSLSYSLKTFKIISIGAKLKTFIQKIKNIGWDDINLDLGINIELPFKKILDGINIGALYKKITPNFSGKSWIVNSDLVVGTAVMIRLLKLMPTVLTFDASIINNGLFCNSSPLTFSFGIEKWIESKIIKLGLRAGYKYFGKSKLSNAIGGSLWFKLFRITYAYILNSNQITDQKLYEKKYNSHTISMSILFNKIVKDSLNDTSNKETQADKNYASGNYDINALPILINDSNAVKFKILSWGAKDISSWRFVIYNGNSGCIKTWEGNGITPDIIVWNGYDDNGNFLDVDNKYTYQLIVENDEYSKFRTKQEEIKFSVIN